MKKSILILALLCGIAVCLNQVEAMPIVIKNASFESPALSDNQWTSNIITDWGIAGSAGVFNPTAVHFSGGNIPDGVQTAYLNSGYIGQWLDTYLGNNKTYTLTVDVGRRLDEPFPGYTIALLVGNPANLSQWHYIAQSDTPITPDLGKFETVSLSYDTGPNNPDLDWRLGINLITKGVQTNFDNVRLNNHDYGATPEPGTLLLLGSGLVGLVGYGKLRLQRRRKQ